MTYMSDHANVRAQLASDASTLNLGEFWEQRMEIEIQEPRPTAVPYHGRSSDIHPQLALALKTVPIEECERRAPVFPNPGIGGKPYITRTQSAADAGERTQAQRRTSSSVFVVQESTGKAEINGKTFERKPNDVFCVPAWSWHQLESTDCQTALHSVTDEPALKKFGLMRRQACNADDVAFELEMA